MLSCYSGVFRVVTHPRHRQGGSTRNAAGASLVVLRPYSSWEVELGVTEANSIRTGVASTVSEGSSA